MDYAKIDRDILTRYEGNPVLTPEDFQRQLGFKMRAVYNSTAVKTPDGRYVMLCRTNQLNHKTLLWGADSADGLNWALRPEPFEMPDDNDLARGRQHRLLRPARHVDRRRIQGPSRRPEHQRMSRRPVPQRRPVRAWSSSTTSTRPTTATW